MERLPVAVCVRGGGSDNITLYMVYGVVPRSVLLLSETGLSVSRGDGELHRGDSTPSTPTRWVGLKYLGSGGTYYSVASF